MFPRPDPSRKDAWGMTSGGLAEYRPGVIGEFMLKKDSAVEIRWIWLFNVTSSTGELGDRGISVRDGEGSQVGARGDAIAFDFLSEKGVS